MKDKNIQHVYLYMDDSGKISKYESYSVFGGIVFSTSREKLEFTDKYTSIIKQIRCSYCNEDEKTCLHDCPELKGINIKNKHRRRLINLSKQYTTFGVVTMNQMLNPSIINRVASKGRFNEYSQRRLIKDVIKNLISRKLIDPNKDVYLHINIDEMPTKSNGYYTLREGLYEEMKNGIVNFNYAVFFPPVINGQLEIQVIYRDSKKDCCIQMADIIANTIRKTMVINNNWFESYNYLKNTMKLDVLLRLPN